MEFPELGSYCTVRSCNRLDFLPFKCDLCHQIFCQDHQTYEQHDCGEGFVKDVKVPVCPLCNQPVPLAKGEDPNIVVNKHIQRDCQSDKAKKLYTNRCSYPSCRKKELVQVNCNACRQIFCLKHRLETSHNCQGPPSRAGNKSRPTGVSKPVTHSTSSRKPQSTTLTNIGADLNRERLQRLQQRQQPNTVPLTQASSEEEAMQIAITASLNEAPTTSHHPPPTQQHGGPDHAHQPNCDEDEALARAIAASLNEQPKPKTKPTSKQGQSSNQSRHSSYDCSVL